VIEKYGIKMLGIALDGGLLDIYPVFEPCF
jgi:hypothetical protein